MKDIRKSLSRTIIKILCDSGMIFTTFHIKKQQLRERLENWLQGLFMIFYIFIYHFKKIENLTETLSEKIELDIAEKRST